ncbi:Replication protein A 70 kDa DNA-binding subunit E [Abeliophyllum distichum]|uniref:Replication protein A 70 kDa DNA-binding subunit E n=1 Tax=Abeliophyllum distichum TaxID=126358 RepID=A0ABD1RY50_9LAMI
MGDKFQLIHDVSPGTTGWTVNVVVAEKFSPRVAQRSPTKEFDSYGFRVQATLYGQNITAFQDELLLGKTYLISNALVKETNAEYKAKSGEIQWTISGRTRIRRVEENNSNLLISTYSFTDFEDLPKYMDSNVDISVIGMIIDIKPRRIIQTRFGKECQVQDLVLVNKRFDTVLLTMWEAFVDNECKYICQNLRKKLVLIGKHLKVTSFNGLSISTKADSSFFIDGEFELVEEFKSWGHTNSEIIDNMISEKHYLTSTPSKLSSKLSVPTDEKDFTEIKNIQGLKTVIPTAASMRLSMDEDEIFYVKAITQELSPDCKFEILFIVDPSQIAGDKNKGKAPVEHIGEPIKFLEPTTKRSLFHSDTDDAQSSKKKM